MSSNWYSGQKDPTQKFFPGNVHQQKYGQNYYNNQNNYIDNNNQIKRQYGYNSQHLENLQPPTSNSTMVSYYENVQNKQAFIYGSLIRENNMLNNKSQINYQEYPVTITNTLKKKRSVSQEHKSIFIINYGNQTKRIGAPINIDDLWHYCFQTFNINREDCLLQDGKGEIIDYLNYNKFLSKTNVAIYIILKDSKKYKTETLKKPNENVNIFPVSQNQANNNQFETSNNSLISLTGEKVFMREITEMHNKSLNNIIKSIKEYNPNKAKFLFQDSYVKIDLIKNYLKNFEIVAIPKEPKTQCTKCECPLSMINHFKFIDNEMDLCQECMSIYQRENNNETKKIIFYCNQAITIDQQENLIKQTKGNEQKWKQVVLFNNQGKNPQINSSNVKSNNSFHGQQKDLAIPVMINPKNNDHLSSSQFNSLSLKNDKGKKKEEEEKLKIEKEEKEKKLMELKKELINDFHLDKKYSNKVIEDSIRKFEFDKVKILNHLLKENYKNLDY